MSFKPGF